MQPALAELAGGPTAERIQGETVIRFEVKAASDVEVSILNAQGQIVRHLAAGGPFKARVRTGLRPSFDDYRAYRSADQWPATLAGVLKGFPPGAGSCRIQRRLKGGYSTRAPCRPPETVPTMSEHDTPSSDRTAATVDGYPGPHARPESGVSASGLGSGERGPCARMMLVRGSGPELTCEMRDLLRGRLRLAATILAAGFGVFLVQHLFAGTLGLPARGFMFGFHVTVTLVLAAIAGLLCRNCFIPLGWLRAAEAVVFGLPAAFFLVLQYLGTLECCDEGFFEFRPGVWLVLIFSYALFVPNPIRRAALVIGIMAAAPLGLLFYLLATRPPLAEVASAGDVTGITLMLVTAAVAAVFGVDTIGSLRQEAFEARKLGQYRLTRRIGAGGMGEVYLAEHQLLKRPCVIKLIRPEKTGDRKVLARFQREVRATAKLSHSNTIEIFDYGVGDDGTFYYVMEYLPGMSLEDLVARFGPMPPARVIHLVGQVCDALEEAHAAGLVHRDIKPGNVFAAERGGVHDVAKLLDFGLVKPREDDEPVHLTMEGSITGSPLYMSPEQAIGEAHPDARSDIYSLGAVMYFLLTGRPPFEGNRPIKVMIAHAHEEVVPPSEHRPDVPSDLEAVVLGCLAKDPAERFQSAAELREALDRCGDAGRWTRADAAAWWQHREPPPAELAVAVAGGG
jgi:eukaryotic-like serine/threonine-protein kinase